MDNMNLGLWIVVGFFGGMGILAMAIPKVIAWFFGITLDSAGRNEFRSVYGGIGLSFAALILYGQSYLPAERDGIILTIFVACLAMAAARFVSIIFSKPNIWILVFLVAELVLGGILYANLETPVPAQQDASKVDTTAPSGGQPKPADSTPPSTATPETAPAQP